MKKINSARKPEPMSPPMPIDLSRGVVLYGMGKDSPNVAFLDEFRDPTPLYLKKAMLKVILERKL